MAKNINYVSHKKSKLKDSNGKPQLPSTSALVEGEIAINYAENVETLSIKNESGTVVTFSSDNYYTEQKLGSGFTGANSAKTVTEIIEEDERITAAALNDLEERKLDASAYTPTDLSNYYKKDETSGKTELSTAFAGKSDTGHTHDDRYYTESELTGSSTTVVVAKASSATTAATAAVANSVALSNVTGADDLKAIEAIAGTSGLLKKTAANTWSLDTNSYSTTAVAVTGATYNTTDKTIDLKNAAGTVVSTVDATAFIKDGMVSNVEVKNVASSGTCLVITFNTDAGKDAINIPISQIFDASNYYTKDELTGSSTTVVVAKASSASTAASAGSVALSNVTGADDLKSIEALTGTSGLLKKTAANTWTLDTTSYSSATQVNTALAGKSNTGHTHKSNEIDGMSGYTKASSASAIATGDTLNQAIGKLEKALDGKQASGSYVTTGRKVSTASGLTGGGDLSADRTIGLATVGTAGTYYSVVVDEYGRVTSGNTTDANTNYYTTGLTVSTAETSNTITVKGNNSAVAGTAVLNSATTSAAGLMSKADKSKLDGIATGAEVNQNAFSKIKINAESTTIDADSKTDTLTVSAGTFVTLTSDATNDKFTIGVSTGTSSSDLARGDHDHDGAYQAKGSYLTGTTKYAGSSTQGGAATSANKLNTDAGSATNPIYFSGGVPTALSYTIEKSVPSNAVFTDTKVTAVGNHYTPSATSADTKSATASSTAELAWGSAVVTGVTLSGDAKGHITSVTLASGKLKTPVTGVTLASGTNNGTVKLTVNGTATDNIAVKGLSGMAYQATSSYSSATQVNTALSGKQDTLTFDGTYNASTNKAATVSTVTNAIGALDGALTGSAGAGKTLTAFSQTDGKVTATFDNISITKSQVSDFAHNQASNTITAMTSYSMASTSGAVATSDSLNTAVGKLEKRIAILEAAIGGMTLVKLTSAQYEALTTKDPNTMYIIND